MPAVVDHEARRRAVAEVTADLIAKAGIEAVTVREVAQAAGYSTAIVSHYFASKVELLFYTYRATVLRAHRRMEAALAAGGLRAYLAALLPLNDEQRRDWLVWFAFWTMAIAEQRLSEEQQQRSRQVTNRFTALLRDRGLDDAAAKEGARRLLITIYGVASQAFFDPETWPAETQLTLLDADLAALGVT
ncbi:TetR/AcrR family transcriptional regulator [Niveispirillum sp. KHB5.9]|uniref:TetR/AcrR family transcriptional regulator n=1 Tax=Niveispirillum sp. KHB5.9 TaxID=3400269 RepID=UPI003A8ABF15